MQDIGSQTPAASEELITFPLKKWTTLYLLGHIAGSLTFFATTNLAILFGEIFVWPKNIYENSADSIDAFFVIVSCFFVFLPLAFLTFYLPLGLYKGKAKVNQICLFLALSQSLFGCSLVAGCLIRFINQHDIWLSLCSLIFLYVASGIFQGIILFSISWMSILKWLVVGLSFTLSQVAALISFWALNNILVSSELVSRFISGTPFDNPVVAILALLILNLLLTPMMTGLVSGLIVRPFFLNNLLSHLIKETSST